MDVNGRRCIDDSEPTVVCRMDTSSPEARDLIRQAIDDEINALEESIRASKYRRNALAPISRLPPETLVAIFSFLSSSAFDEGVGYLEWLRVTHVCRRWRETALNFPHLWSRINFTTLTTAGIAELPARAKMTPLYWEAIATSWSGEHFDAFERQLEIHIFHTRHLRLSGKFQTVLERLVSPAPALEYLALSNSSARFYLPSQIVVHDTLFNCTAPKLTSLQLVGCEFSWKSRLFKGLQTLEIRSPSEAARPTLEDWLDAFNEMTQLETLVLDSGIPFSPLSDILEPRRAVTLPSLTQFDITSSAEECACALSHLTLPALTLLRVQSKSYNHEGNDVGILIPHIARNACGPQDFSPLQSIVVRGGITHVELLAWTLPDVEVEDSNRVKPLHSERVFFVVTASDDVWWRPRTGVRILDALWTQLSTDAISTLSVEGLSQLSKEFWLSHASSLTMLKQACLASGAVKAFRETLAEDSPPNGLRFPRLSKLILVEVALTALGTYRLHDILRKRLEQGTPLEVLDLRTCIATERAIQLLAEIVGDVQGPAKPLEAGNPMFSNWKGGVDFFDEQEKRMEDDYGIESGDGDEDDDSDDGWDDYVEDSDPYSDEF
jgi:F-box-like